MGVGGDAADSLTSRPFKTWPDFRCVAIERSTGAACLAAASWQQRPVDQAETVWTYCNRHRPNGATRIPDDAPFVVTRIRLEVAVTGVPGSAGASQDEAVRRVVYAIEDVGGLATHVQVRGRNRRQAAAVAPVGRLQLAGPPEPVTAPRPLRKAPERPLGRHSWRRWKTG